MAQAAGWWQIIQMCVTSTPQPEFSFLATHQEGTQRVKMEVLNASRGVQVVHCTLERLPNIGALLPYSLA